MTLLLLRVVKRRTSLELTDPAEVCSVEFRTKNGDPDLKVSAYEIEDEQSAIVQAHAEHAANVPLHPPCGGPSLHFGGVGAPIATPASRFRFTREAHREVYFNDESELLSGVAAVLVERVSRQRGASRDEVRTYLRGRLEAGDPEWSDFCEVNGAWKKWGAPSP